LLDSIGAVIALQFLLQVDFPQSTSCRDSVLTDPELQSYCHPYLMLHYESYFPLKTVWTDQVRCQFPNQTTSYVYQIGNDQFLDIKGLSGRSMSANYSTEAADSCEEVKTQLRQMLTITFDNFQPSSIRKWSEDISLSLIVSEANCQILYDDLGAYLDLLFSEGRHDSELLCIPNRLIQGRNPSSIRRYIHQNRNPMSEALFLIGRDIPVFEIFNDGSATTSLYHGQSDLPYGNLLNAYWEKPIKKTNSRLKNHIYHKSGNIYKLDYPTPYAFDMARFNPSSQAHHPYVQDLGVGRWIENSNLKTDFASYLTRRKAFRPKANPNFVASQGGESVMFRYGENQGWKLIKDNLSEFLQAQEIKPGSYQIFSETDLSNFLKYLDPETDILYLSEHGTPGDIGNFHSSEASQIDWWPRIIHFSSCFAGSWTLVEPDEPSLIRELLNSAHGPVLLTAAQTQVYFRMIENSDSLAKDVFLHSWKNISIARRQTDSFNTNFEHLDLRSSGTTPPRKSEYLLQLFSILGVFGDPSIEL